MLRSRTSAGSRPSCAGDQVDRPLHRERGFRAAGAAIGRVRHLVGGGDPRVDGEVVDLVGPGQMHRGVVGDAGADRIPGAAIDDEAVAEREDAAVVVEADLDVVDLVARMAGAHEMLAPVLDPAHRPFTSARQERNQQVLGIDVALARRSRRRHRARRSARAPRAGSAPWRPRAAPSARPGVDDQIVTESVRGS